MTDFNSAQTPGTWPPPPTGAAYGQSPMENTSGMKSSVPPEIAALKWNWGAFSFSWIWCLNHKMMALGLGIMIVSFIPYVSLLTLPAVIYLGISGHKLGWQNRRFEGGVPQFFDVQSAWMKWGVGLLILNLLLVPILAAILFPVFSKAREKARLRAGYYSHVINVAPRTQKPLPRH